MYNVFVSRGESFWKAAANYLIRNDFKEANLPINKKELELIREHFEYFNKESSIGACPAGLPKEECEREWKTTDSVQYFAHADMGNGRFFLHNFIPGVFIKPLDENEKNVVLPVEDFKYIVETVGGMEYDFINFTNNVGRKCSRKHKSCFSGLSKDRIKKRKENIIIDLSGIADNDMKREKYIAWEDLKTVYSRL